MKIEEKIPTPTSIQTPNLLFEEQMEDLHQDTVLDFLKAEYKEVETPDEINKMFLHESLFSWKNLKKYDANVFNHLEMYSQLEKHGYTDDVPKHKLQKEHARIHRIFTKKAVMDRFANELELSYVDKVVRFYANY